MTEIIRRREPYIVITALIGLIVILEHYIPIPFLTYLTSEIRIGAIVIGAFIILFGGVGAYLYHIKIISAKDDGWKYSVGGGLRYALNPAERFNIRLDLSWVDSGFGVVLNIREAF